MNTDAHGCWEKNFNSNFLRKSVYCYAEKLLQVAPNFLTQRTQSFAKSQFLCGSLRLRVKFLGFASLRSFIGVEQIAAAKDRRIARYCFAESVK
jgi:hypothetical protein